MNLTENDIDDMSAREILEAIATEPLWPTVAFLDYDYGENMGGDETREILLGVDDRWLNVGPYEIFAMVWSGTGEPAEDDLNAMIDNEDDGYLFTYMLGQLLNKFWNTVDERSYPIRQAVRDELAAVR